MVDKISDLNIGGGNVQQYTAAVPEISDEDFEKFLVALSKERQPSTILLVSDGFAKNYVPQQLKIPLPQPLGTIFDVKHTKLDFDALSELSEDHLVKYSLTPGQCIRIEELTRMQSKCQLWNKYRQGRITSSVVYAVTKTNLGHPSRSLVQKICYPQSCIFQTEATKYSCSSSKIF